MPYRIDIPDAADDSLDRLIELGALDVESTSGRGMAAVMPDSISIDQVARALGVDDISVSPAVSHDNGSVWLLSPRPIRIGSLRIVPAGFDAEVGDIRLIDTPAFGTGFHPTTALCLEALEEISANVHTEAMLDVGTGSGVLAIAALKLSVLRATAIDIDDDALSAAADNARLNGFEGRLELARGGPESMTGTWPMVVANILAAPLIEMAPALVRRVGHQGQLVLSGIPRSVEADVTRAYVHLGMRRLKVTSRGDWVCLVFRASW
jgi:ribosomal protein L11 methyltransferase